MAENCCVSPAATDAVPGLTVMEVSVAGFTVRVAEPDTELRLAVMVVDPTAIEVVKPLAPTDATTRFDDDQKAEAETSCVEPFV